MNSVKILQVDNRPNYDVLLAAQSVNLHMCGCMKKYNTSYEFKNLNDISNDRLIDKQPGDRRGWDNKYKKMFALQQAVLDNQGSVIIFLDSDAWVQNPNYVEQLIDRINSCNKTIGAFSRDPYIESNTYINSGSFIIKCNTDTIKMLKDIINTYRTVPKSPHRHKNHIKFHDQYYVSQYVEENKDRFHIYQPHVLNTPDGQVLRHYWFNKRDDDVFNQQIQQLLSAKKHKHNKYDFDKHLDDMRQA